MEKRFLPRPVKRLPPHVAERIAAGEMIERPCSIVKELIENSLDAGCTEISVFLEEGGKRLIEVWDNGSGMSPEDLEVCIERHATSKLSSLDDLDRIATLGFRGEALPSIAAVSDLSIVTRTPDGEAAYEYSLGDWSNRTAETLPRPKKITFGQFIDSQHGTRIRSLGIFSQIPARLKFLKSQAAEVSQVREWMERLSLAYPHVGFRLTSDDRTLLNLRPQSEIDRVKTILSDGEDYPVLFATNEQDGFRDLGFQVRAYWLQGASSPNTRKLIQIVNSRAIRDRMLQQAILSPFKQALMPGQFPSVALFIQLNPAALDVNVHPTKTEVRFLETKKVFHSIEILIKSLIAKHGSLAVTPVQSFSDETRWTHSPTQWTAKEPFETQQSSMHARDTSQGSNKTFSSHADASQGELQWRSSHRNSTPSQTYLEEQWNINAASENQVSERYPVPFSPVIKTPQFLQSARFVGSLFNTYIVYEDASELILIDQHAADERVRYEKLKKKLPGSSSDVTLSAQALLIPEVVKFPTENRVLLESRLASFQKLGFDVEIFGEDSLLFRAVPHEWGTQQLKTRLKNLVERLMDTPDSENASPELMDERLFEALASQACHSSVRAGDRLEGVEMKALVEQLFQCEHPWNCPHGRPTVVKIPEGKIEEWFRRK